MLHVYLKYVLNWNIQPLRMQTEYSYYIRIKMERRVKGRVDGWREGGSERRGERERERNKINVYMCACVFAYFCASDRAYVRVCVSINTKYYVNTILPKQSIFLIRQLPLVAL